ncbi:MAG: Crp/Fnr family transcriptional regulator [Gammaproteobacteria bacterium]
MTITPHDAWCGEADCRSCSLRASVLFAGLAETDFDLIHRPIDDYLVRTHQAIYRAGDPGSAVFTIRSGLVKLVRYLPDGQQRIVRLARGTDAVGLEAILGQSYQHDAIALSDARVCRIPAEVVRQLDRKASGLHDEVLRRWQRALNEADRWLTELSTGTARQRVARLLLWLSEGGDDASCELFTREDVGAMLGVTTETASRVIAEFRRQGHLTQDSSGRITCQRAALKKIAGD